MCLYFDFKPCCDNIKSEKGNNFTFFTINFKKNIAEDDYITNYSSILNNKKVKKQGVFNIHIILLLCRIFGVSKYIITDTSNIWIYNFIKYRKSYYQRIGFVPLDVRKYNKSLKIINNLTVTEYKKLYYDKFKTEFFYVKELKKKYFMKSLEYLLIKSKETEKMETLKMIFSTLVFNLKLFNIFDIIQLQYKFNTTKSYSKKYFNDYNLQYIYLYLIPNINLFCLFIL